MSSFISLLLCLFLLLCPFLSTAVLTDTAYFDRYTVEHGISQNSITCSIEDSLGFIWFGTQNGLNQMDGYGAKKFKPTDYGGSIQGNWITACAQDNAGNLWFSTATSGLNRYDAQTSFFTSYDTHSQHALLNDNNVLSLFVDNTFLWIGTSNGGLNRLDLTTMDVTVFNSNLAPLREIRSLVKDHNDVLWLGTASGLYYLDNSTQTIQRFSVEKNNDALDTLAVWAIAEDVHGTLWVTGRGGSVRIDVFRKVIKQLNMPVKSNQWGTSVLNTPTGIWLGTYGAGVSRYNFSGELEHQYIYDPIEKNSLSNNYILSLYQDSKKNIWIGTDGGGVNRFLPTRQLFHHQKNIPDLADSLSHSFVRAITRDHVNNLWVATREGLNKQLSGEAQYQRYFHQKEQVKSLPADNIFALFSSASHGLWLGTYGGGLARYDTNSDSFIRYHHDLTRNDSLISNRIYAITAADEQRLWLGSNSGLSLFDPQTDSSRHYQHDEVQVDSLSDNVVFSILKDRSNQIWVGTRAGLNLMKQDGSGFKHYQQGRDQLTANMVTALHQDNEGFIWIGTMRGLNRLDPTNDDIIQLTEQQGLIDENIFAIEEDNLGFLWISSNNGLMRINKSDLSISHIKAEVGLQGRSFILGASYQDSSGRLYFGGVNGFNEFDPIAVTPAKAPPRVQLTKFLLLNREVKVHQASSESDFYLEKHINSMRDIELTHSDTLFSFEFTSAQSLDPQPLEYAYQLRGFDQNWLYTSDQKRFATYTNLPAGTYQFGVKARFQDGQWGGEKQLNILIKPAPWLTWWAYCVYFTVIASVLFLLLWLIYRRKLAEREKEHSLQLIAAKDTFLATISHEFKTPLTLILGPLAGLIARHTHSTDQEALKGIARNAERLLLLVNNVLTHQSLRNELSTPQPVELSALIVSHLQSFSVLAEQHQVKLLFNLAESPKCVVDFIPDAADQLLSNLLHNAIKFTGSGGEVELQLRLNDGFCDLIIRDTGVGIAEDELDAIFVSGKRGSLSEGKEGFGLGLAIVKDIVTEHQGEITLKSEKGKGSVFTVSLPITSKIVGQEENCYLISALDSKKALEPEFKILIVEDNTELRRYLVSILEPYFSCFVAANGEVGLAQVAAIAPDLVISDVMMPIMSGFEFLAQLRSELETCHIPVLILSAYDSPVIRKEGFDLLADEFLAKPFKEDVLLGRVNNLLSLRALIKRSNLAMSLSGSVVTQIDNEARFSTRDSQFISQLNDVLALHFSDVALSLEQLAGYLHLTERTLQNKTKALFEMSPMDYVREFRLEKAKDLLAATDMAIGVVAQTSGFNSQSYFARCFKATMGMSAKQYRNLQQQSVLN